MLVFGIFIILLVVGIVLIVLGNKCWDRDKHHFLHYHDDDLTFWGWCISVISGVIILIMLVLDHHKCLDKKFLQSYSFA